MNKISRALIRTFGGSVKSIGPLQDDNRIYKSLRTLLNSSDGMTVADPYDKSVWVFASINAIAQNISRVPFYIYNEKKKDTKNINTSGPLYDLFTNPNPYMIGSTLFFATVLYMELYGESFWVFEGRKNITEIPKEIWVVNPSKMEPIFEEQKDGTKQFKGYWKYNINEKNPIIFAPHEILHIKYFNPYNEIRGIAPLDASRAGVEQDYFANRYNKQFFKDGVSLSGIIQVPEQLDDTSFNRLRDQFEERHGGYEKAHKVGIIESGATFVATNAMTQRDMEFSVLKRVIRGEILAAFKTNEVILGNYENIQSYEGIKQAHESFWKETLLPKVTYLEDFLWAKFFSKLASGKFWGGFDLSTVEALREDYNLKVTMAVELNKMGYPINVINKRLDMGFADMPWGDKWWVKVGTVSIDEAEDMIKPTEEPSNDKPTKPSDDPKADDDEEKPTKPDDTEQPTVEPNPGKSSDALHTNRDDSLWTNYIARQVPLEMIFKNKIKKFLFEQRKRILGNLYNKDIQIFNYEEEYKKLSTIFTFLYSMASTTGIEILKDEIILDGNLGMDDVNLFVSSRIKSNTNIILNTIQNSLLKIIDDNKDSNVDDSAKQIRDLYNKLDGRVLTIARTESASILNGVKYLIMKSYGIKYHKWLSKGEKSRHNNLHGKIVKIGESFRDDITLRYPLDNLSPKEEIINCLCMTTPIIKVRG